MDKPACSNLVDMKELYAIVVKKEGMKQNLSYEEMFQKVRSFLKI